MISNILQILKKYIWIPLVLFISLLAYFFFRSKNVEKNITDYLNKNNQNNKNKIIDDIKDKEQLQKDLEENSKKEREKAEIISMNYDKKIEELKIKEKEEISKFEKMSNEDLADLLAEKYKLSKIK